MSERERRADGGGGSAGACDRWTAVVGRDRRFDGAFVYAVRSTRVYCRPSCPSRRPRPSQATFFATPAEAERAGFRACRRCDPRSASTAIERTIERARAYMDEHLDEPLPLAALAREVGWSPFHLQRAFKRLVGLSPKAYASARRLDRWKQRVKGGDDVLRATYAAGFGSSRALYAQAAALLGMTPGAYRRGGRGLRIRYAIVDGPLGRVLVAATERGVCAVSLGASDRALEEGLRREFPNAGIERDPSAMAELAHAVVDELEGGGGAGRGAPAVPIDLHGTEFQLRVWGALRRIPRGDTRSYREVAEALGMPAGARAVARACAANKVAGLVPCHRVVREDGGLGGYRWGLDRKAKLLGRETKPA